MPQLLWKEKPTRRESSERGKWSGDLQNTAALKVAAEPREAEARGRAVLAACR
jgi:hypothetical protein